MKMLYRLAAVASAAFFLASAHAQNAGTVTNHAFAIGKGAGFQGYTSLLCGAGQLALGQSAADPVCQTITGDITISAAGVTAIGTAKVTSAMLRNSGALSLIGRSANSAGVPADIAAVAASSCAFIESGSTIICGQLATAGIANNAVDNTKIRQSLARAVVGNCTNATANVTDIQGSTDQVFRISSAGTGCGFGQVNLASSAAVTGTLPVANGGTGDTGTAWAAFTPAVTCGTATFTTTSARFKQIGKTTFAELDVSFTTLGTCTNLLTFNLPATAQSGGSLTGRENTVSGKAVGCSIVAAGTTAGCSLADATNFANTERLLMSGVYESQ